jgi:hypothetical protein
MSEITIEELEKAARNIERISVFIGERRDWIVGEGGESKANDLRDHARALAKSLAESTGIEPDPEFKVKLPRKLEPAAKVSAVRLAKFGGFLRQLRKWFSSQGQTGLPEGSGDAVQGIHASLALVCAAVDSILGPLQSQDAPPPTVDDLIGEIDDSPVLEVDTSARLELQNHELKPLVQTFKGVTELTVHAKDTMDDFLTKQNVKLEPHEMRKLHDKLLKWIVGTPLHQVLVIKLSGLSGKPNVYSSYQPKGGVSVQELGDG